MSRSLAGKSITVTTKKSLNTDEIAELVRRVFGATGCPTCTSGGNFTLREETELTIEPALNAHASIT